VKNPVRWIVVLVLFTGLVHVGALRNGFYWDDRALILEGHLIRSWGNIPAIFAHEMWYNVDLGARADQARVDTYRPLSNLSFLLDHQVWGLRPFGYHLTNLLIHLANVALFFWILLAVTTPPTALTAAAIFAFHPLAVEPIHYVSARTDSLPVLFGLLGILLARKERNLGVAGLFLLSALSKETGLAFSVAWLASCMVRRRGWLYPLGSAALYWILRWAALGSSKSVMDARHLGEMVLNFPVFVLRFFRQFLVPLSNFPMEGVTIVH
jgi:protein O-mannosyl-transferase